MDRPPHGPGPERRWAPRWILILALCFAALVTPGLAAQAPDAKIETDAEVQPVDAPILPGGDPVVVPIKISVQCEPPTVTFLPLEIGHRLETSNDKVSVSLNQASHTITTEMQECIALPVTVEYEVEATLIFSSWVPAYEEIEFRFYTSVNDEEHLAATWTQQAAFQGSFVVDVYPTTLFVDPGHNATSTIRVINRANTPLSLTIALTDPPEHGMLDFPATLTVPYTPQAGTDMITFALDYERLQPGSDTFTLQFTAAPTQQPEATLPPSSLTYRVEETGLAGTAAESPAGSIGWVVLAVLVGLWRNARRGR